jgi:hypothetical protein
MTPALPSRINKITRRKTIDGRPVVYTVIDEDVFVAPSNGGKAFCLQKLRFEDGREELRICYYMIAHRPRMKGKWAFGQYAPMMTADEMRLIVEKAKSKGWI